jgi:hypothetical protein
MGRGKAIVGTLVIVELACETGKTIAQKNSLTYFKF